MDGRRRQIVGIVRDAQVSQAQDAISSYMYLPAARGNATRHLRSGANARWISRRLRRRSVPRRPRLDANLVVNVQPLSDNLGLLQTLSQITAGVAGIVEPARRWVSPRSASTASSPTS